MTRTLLSLVEPFILALLATVLLASFFPARGPWVPVVDHAADIGIFLLFFLHGAKLSRDAIWKGASNWRLHLAVLGMTFAIFPLLGLGFGALPFMPPAFGAGLLFLTLLPSTVQSSIAFTALARGNVAAALCAATFSNLIGIVLTPALVTMLMGAHGNGVSWAAAQAIILQLLLPFMMGHLLRPWIGGHLARYKTLLARVDRGSILLVVYAAFGAAVVDGLWRRVAPESLLLLAVLSLILLGLVLAISWLIGRILGFSYEDAVVMLFCGSKKSLATGVPMAGILFAPAQVGVILLPVMIFHQMQLIACALLAPRLAAHREDDGDRG